MNSFCVVGNVRDLPWLGPSVCEIADPTTSVRTTSDAVAPASSRVDVVGDVDKDAKSKTPRPRKPPLPHDALKVQKSTVAKANELDYLGLDPGLVE